MEIVASKFERDGLIDYKEFVNSLKDKKPVSCNVYFILVDPSIWFGSWKSVFDKWPKLVLK